ncbi:MCE family protein [Flaviaesturariibacter flavus]|uniref:MCE family protein n=1 Tax=Flaviaesturariibacter flavus TaxID=2502780 RepID=A0A4R1BCC3_9BACT|nr:MlaD family protein [Flaviaesturariibacter flavus]TCJ14598.1 MCE family protein [Flaviaesturariibacter flavus]
METRRNRKAIIVGLFFVVGIAIILAAIFKLGGQKKLFASSFQVQAFFPDANGLRAGNNIWYEGVNVGTVKSVAFQDNFTVRVVLNIETKAQRFIHRDAKVKLGADGLIGNKLVVISGGTAAAPVIQQDDVLQVEKALSPDDLLATLQTNSVNLLAITADLKTVSREMAAGKGTLGRLLKDEDLYRNLQTIAAALQQSSLNTRQLTANLERYSSRFSTSGNFANELVSDTLVFSRLRATILQLQGVAAKADAIASNLVTTSGSLNDSAGTAGLLLHDKAAAESIKTTLLNLQAASKKLDENMEALQHNFLLRGFFRRKAKSEQAAVPKE